MILTFGNLEEWLDELDALIFEMSGMENYSITLDDATWLDMYNGFTPDEAAYEELTASD